MVKHVPVACRDLKTCNRLMTIEVEGVEEVIHSDVWAQKVIEGR